MTRRVKKPRTELEVDALLVVEDRGGKPVSCDSVWRISSGASLVFW